TSLTLSLSLSLTLTAELRDEWIGAGRARVSSHGGLLRRLVADDDLHAVGDRVGSHLGHFAVGGADGDANWFDVLPVDNPERAVTHVLIGRAGARACGRRGAA